MDSCSICTDQVRNWGSKCHFSTFYFILFCVHLHFQRWKCYFYCTFWYLFESNVLYGCILHVYWIYQQAGERAFKAHEIKTILLIFLFGVARCLVPIFLFYFFPSPSVLSVGRELHGFSCGVKQDKGLKQSKGFIVRVLSECLPLAK